MMCARRPAFVTHELLPAIAAVIVFVGVLLPVVAAVRDGRLAMWAGIALAVALGLVLWLPEWWMERCGRRQLHEPAETGADAGRRDDAHDP